MVLHHAKCRHSPRLLLRGVSHDISRLAVGGLAQVPASLGGMPSRHAEVPASRLTVPDQSAFSRGNVTPRGAS